MDATRTEPFYVPNNGLRAHKYLTGSASVFYVVF